MTFIGGDSMDQMDRADSAASTQANFSSIHIGVLTAKNESAAN